jgi:hypothetical protein
MRSSLVVCPDITIRDRLRVLLPSDPENYYESRGLVPDDMIGAIRAARVVVTNYHAFKLRETLPLPKFARAVLQGRGAVARAILLPVMDPYNPAGSSRFVDLRTSKDLLWTTRADRCHVKLVVGDSEWELGFCETIENALGNVVLAYVKNHSLGFEVPYAAAGGEHLPARLHPEGP